MKLQLKILNAFIFGLFAVFSSGLLAGDLPPKDGKSAVEITKIVEAKKIGTITSIEYDDGEWEVDVYKTGNETTIYLDAAGTIKRQKTEPEMTLDLPASGSKALSEILTIAAAREKGTITEAEFDRGRWEIEFRRNDGSKLEIRVDSKTGNPS